MSQPFSNHLFRNSVFLALTAVLLLWFCVDGDSFAQELPQKIYDALEAERYEEALPELEKAAANGSWEAEYFLGIIYEQGAGVQRDNNKARAHYLIAAREGHFRAQYALAKNFYLGNSYAEAFVWARKASESGSRPAAYLLSELYREGKGTQRNEVEAEHWRKFAFSGRK